MAIETVQDERSLPLGPSGKRTSYLVLSSDRHLVIEHRDGRVYRRADGQEWQGDGFHVESNERMGGTPVVSRAALKF